MKKCGLLMLLAMLVGLGCLSGCGEKLPPGMPKLFPATLKVTYDDGAPVAGAMVILVAEDSAKVGTWSHTGNTDATGTTPIYTQGKYKGLPAAKYKVTVSKTVSEGEPMPGEPMDEASAKAYEAWKKSANKEKLFKVVGLEYEQADKTPLTITVDTKGVQTFEVKVGKAVKLRQPDPWVIH